MHTIETQNPHEIIPTEMVAETSAEAIETKPEGGEGKGKDEFQENLRNTEHRLLEIRNQLKELSYSGDRENYSNEYNDFRNWQKTHPLPDDMASLRRTQEETKKSLENIVWSRGQLLALAAASVESLHTVPSDDADIITKVQQTVTDVGQAIAQATSLERQYRDTWSQLDAIFKARLRTAGEQEGLHGRPASWELKQEQENLARHDKLPRLSRWLNALFDKESLEKAQYRVERLASIADIEKEKETFQSREMPHDKLKPDERTKMKTSLMDLAVEKIKEWYEDEIKGVTISPSESGAVTKEDLDALGHSGPWFERAADLVERLPEYMQEHHLIVSYRSMVRDLRHASESSFVAADIANRDLQKVQSNFERFLDGFLPEAWAKLRAVRNKRGPKEAGKMEDAEDALAHGLLEKISSQKYWPEEQQSTGEKLFALHSPEAARLAIFAAYSGDPQRDGDSPLIRTYSGHRGETFPIANYANSFGEEEMKKLEAQAPEIANIVRLIKENPRTFAFGVFLDEKTGTWSKNITCEEIYDNLLRTTTVLVETGGALEQRLAVEMLNKRFGSNLNLWPETTYRALETFLAGAVDSDLVDTAIYMLCRRSKAGDRQALAVLAADSTLGNTLAAKKAYEQSTQLIAELLWTPRTDPKAEEDATMFAHLNRISPQMPTTDLQAVRTFRDTAEAKKYSVEAIQRPDHTLLVQLAEFATNPSAALLAEDLMQSGYTFRLEDSAKLVKIAENEKDAASLRRLGASISTADRAVRDSILAKAVSIKDLAEPIADVLGGSDALRNDSLVLAYLNSFMFNEPVDLQRRALAVVGSIPPSQELYEKILRWIPGMTDHLEEFTHDTEQFLAAEPTLIPLYIAESQKLYGVSREKREMYFRLMRKVDKSPSQ